MAYYDSIYNHRDSHCHAQFTRHAKGVEMSAAILVVCIGILVQLACITYLLINIEEELKRKSR